ncbi:hypothetical protein [Massilia sp. 9I]|uniref:hypothetical protein n=1 Tax=Massilia sp. 9I TaxID=2653152 RepID=UPI0012EF0495|nr:hypothetical protein [Massilia sp. 9I]VXC56974.1 exported hypothetical protein [Massilia sp. 9I]
MKKIAISVFAALSALGAAPSHAVDFGKLASLAKPNQAAGASAADVARNTRNALVAFATAELGLLEALGGYENLSALRTQVEGMQKGDAGVNTASLQAAVDIHKSASVEIEKKIAGNAQLDASQKKMAAKSMLAYVQGLVATKQTLGSLQGLARNPMSLGSDAGTVLFAVKELPGMLSGGLSTTGTLFKYLGANGVDLSEAKSAADTMPK